MSVKGIVSFKPLKSGTIAVLMEVPATHDNLMALTNLYGKEGVLVSESDLVATDDKAILLKGLMEQTKAIYFKVLEIYQEETVGGAMPLSMSDCTNSSITTDTLTTPELKGEWGVQVVDKL